MLLRLRFVFRLVKYHSMKSSLVPDVQAGLKGAWVGYERILASNPLLTKMAIGGLGGFLADAVAQRFTPVTLSKSGGSAPTEPPPFDVMRSLRFAAFGGLLGAPLSHFYYGALDKAIFADAPHAPRTILTKIAIDQLIWSPITSLAFLAGLRTLEGRPDLVQASLETSFLPLIKAQWTVWPLAHAINFRFVPTEQRVLYVNVVSLAYTVVVSMIANAKLEEPQRGRAPDI